MANDTKWTVNKWGDEWTCQRDGLTLDISEDSKENFSFCICDDKNNVQIIHDGLQTVSGAKRGAVRIATRWIKGGAK